MLLLLPIAFVSGVLTALSPCVLPILPVVLGTGADGDKSRVKGMVVGVIGSFVVLALMLSTLVVSLGISADYLRWGAAIVLALFGLTLVMPKWWEGIQVRLEGWMPQPKTDRSGFGGGVLTGAVLGVVWTPCVGPILAAVTTLAALQTFSVEMVLVTLAYGAGIGLVLLGLGMGGVRVSARMGWYKRNQLRVRRWFGIILVATALLIVSGGERRFQAWVLDHLPQAIANPVEEFENWFGVQEFLPDRPGRVSDEREVVNRVRLAWESEGVKVPLDEIIDGCPVMDCIPSIDDPVYESVETADEWLRSEDVVFVLEHNNIVRVYAQRIMNWHEIVNDWFGKEPVMVTFCPLCGTAVAFERVVDGKVTQFGVSGKLHNSDLIMYDRMEGSLWQQITGEAIVGPAARRDEVLKQFFLVTLSWEEAKEKYADAEVLSRDTGFRRDYDRYPYGNYETSGEIYFPLTNFDTRLPPKTWVGS